MKQANSIYSKKYVIIIVISILLFFSISFLTVLFQLNSPLNNQIDSSLNIGFPLVYYNQFMVDLPIPNSHWNLQFLFLDIAFSFLVVLFTNLIVTKISKR